MTFNITFTGQSHNLLLLIFSCWKGLIQGKSKICATIIIGFFLIIITVEMVQIRLRKISVLMYHELFSLINFSNVVVPCFFLYSWFFICTMGVPSMGQLPSLEYRENNFFFFFLILINEYTATFYFCICHIRHVKLRVLWNFSLRQFIQNWS